MIKNERVSTQEGEEKLEDILRSIRNIIDDNQDRELKMTQSEPKIEASTKEEMQILELTELANLKDENTLLSDEAIKKSMLSIDSFTENLAEKSYSKNNSIDDVIYDLIKPMMQDWLNNNLPKIVERVVTEEIRRLVPKK